MGHLTRDVTRSGWRLEMFLYEISRMSYNALSVTRGDPLDVCFCISELLHYALVTSALRLVEASLQVP